MRVLPVRLTVRTLCCLALLALVVPAVLPTSSGLNPLNEPSALGSWDTPFNGQVPAISMALLHDGRVLYFSGVEADDSDSPTNLTYMTSDSRWGETRILDLGTGKITAPDHSYGGGLDLFCTGLTFLADGTIVAAGGTDWKTLPDDVTTPLQGTVDARVFDPEQNDWSLLDDIAHKRWYPSVLQLPDGSPAVFAGITNLTMPNTMVLPAESYDIVNQQWTTLEGSDNLLPMYPRLSVVPGGPLKGEIFYSTAATLWGPFGEHPAEATWSLFQSFDADEGAWHQHGPSQYGARQYAVTVMLPLGSGNGYAPEYVSFGGTIQRGVVATPLSERIDLSGTSPVTTAAAPMNEGRWNHQGILLPTGDVLAVGGGAYDNVIVHGQPNEPILSAELYDPDTDTWTLMAEATVPRMYHSTAVLLPDGSVLTGGHVPLANPSSVMRNLEGDPMQQDQIVETRLEVFRPPYMESTLRPEIVSAPDAGTYGDTITLTVDAQLPISSVMLLHPGATTHAYDSAQRGIELDIVSQDGSSVVVTLPPDNVVAQPGYWMVFANVETADGTVPSEAAWLHLE